MHIHQKILRSSIDKTTTLTTAIPLAIGFAIYFSCRSKSLLYMKWIPFKKTFGVESLQSSIHSRCAHWLADSQMAKIIVYSLPGALFAFSLTYYLKKRYWHGISKTICFGSSRTCVLIAYTCLLAAFPELLQNAKILPGTYSSADIALATLAILAAFIA